MKESGSEIRDFWQDLLMICHPGWGCTWLYGCGSSSSLSAGFQPAYIIQYMMYIIYPYVYINMYIYIIHIYILIFTCIHTFTTGWRLSATNPKNLGATSKSKRCFGLFVVLGPPSTIQSPKPQIQNPNGRFWTLDFGFWIMDWFSHHFLFGSLFLEQVHLGFWILDFPTSFGFCIRYFEISRTRCKA